MATVCKDVKPCVMHDGQYRLVARSEIMAAKCLALRWKIISETKVWPAVHSVRGTVANDFICIGW